MRARKTDRRSREIIEILADVIGRIHTDCVLISTDLKGNREEIDCPEINYIFGNATYVKENLDDLSKSPYGTSRKLPLIALFCPFNEQRNSVDYYSKAKVRILIACSTSRIWNNEQRLESSFKGILRPIYRKFLEELKNDGRFDFGYDGHVDHDYSENYSYGRYGAFTDKGEEVSEPIDAINISNLELIVKLPNCI